MKPKRVYIVIVLLISLTGALAYLYHVKQKETVALNLKLKLLETSKKKPVAWEKLLTDVKDVQGERSIAEQSKPSEPKSPIAIAINEQPTDILAKQVDLTVKNLQTQSLDDINDAIRIVEELIEREPDSYSAYKAKLILLLTKETAHLQNVSDDDVGDLLEEMAAFDIVSTVALRKEAFLIARTDARIDTLDESIEESETELADVDIELEFAEEDSDEESELLAEADTLDQRIADQTAEVERLEDELEADLLANETLFNEDIIEIPLQRRLARGEYEAVTDEAEALLDEFGDSVMGYYYLIRSLELSKQTDTALDVIADSGLSDANTQELERRLRRSRWQDPKDYWKRLKF